MMAQLTFFSGLCHGMSSVIIVPRYWTSQMTDITGRSMYHEVEDDAFDQKKWQMINAITPYDYE